MSKDLCHRCNEAVGSLGHHPLDCVQLLQAQLREARATLEAMTKERDSVVLIMRSIRAKEQAKSESWYVQLSALLQKLKINKQEPVS